MEATRAKVLVVDDEESVRSVLCETLVEAGEAVISADDGQQALELLSAGDVGVMLLDIGMPGLSGIDVLAEVRAQSPEVSVIMVTAIADLATGVNAIRQGACDYVTKPFDVDVIATAVQRAQERRVLFLLDRRHKREVEEKLSHVHDKAHDADGDAEHLLQGGGIATLAAESPDSMKATMNRQIDAFKRAVSIATERRGRLEAELIRDGCEDLKDVAQLIQLETLEAFEDLQESLQKTEAFYKLLSRRGLKEGSRCSGWSMSQFEIGLLQGGRGYPSIAHYIKQGKGILGLDK